jgi:DNA-binding response OmpR family regulator
MNEAMQESNGALVVAVVEDDPRIQQLLLAEIQDEGHNGVIFNSAEDFLENASSQAFDLVLLDLMLPGMDGLACLKQMQDNAVQASPPRVVIVTALNDANKKQEALRNGAEDYVLKPDLFERLPELLRPSQQG